MNNIFWKKNVNILKQNVSETKKKGYWNISKSCGSWVIDENNILHALIIRKRDQILRALFNEKVATSVSHQNVVTF